MGTAIAQGTARAARPLTQLHYEYWFFGEALALDGLVLAAEATGSRELRETALALLRPWMAGFGGRPPRPSDVFAPIMALVRLQQTDGQDDYLSAATRVADYLLSMPHAGGAVLHELRGYQQPMVFVDYIYYAGPYLGLLGQALDEDRYSQAAVTETLGHIRQLQEPQSGLFHHVYGPATGKTNGVAWGRGNGWAMLGLVDTLAVVSRDDPGWLEIQDSFQMQLNRCLALQSDTGHWHTILDDPNSPLEPSIAAFFVAAMRKAHRMDLAGTDVLQPASQAWAAVWQNLQPDGAFPISMTEWPAWDPDPYYHRPSGVNAWGQGCFLRAAAEEVEHGGRL